ncbi:hypothetical protein TWF506_003723 [Arthrobotrys conoides]|uniref:BTB domain-containing protein n=1 Tax=Arthrobotrys conoides TaxID=74498 RepID=A0AAN8ND70_9PEZI
MSEPKRDPFECLNPFRKSQKKSTDTIRSTGKSQAGTVVSVSTMPPSKKPSEPPEQAITTPRSGKQQQQKSETKPPKSPLGHQPDHTPWTKRKNGEESPLFRKSLIGLRPHSPAPTGGVPDEMKIPHGLENPVTKKEKGPDGLKEGIETIGQGEEKDGFALTDDDDKEWEDEDGEKEHYEPSPEILATPIIRLVLDHTDSSNHDEKVTFHVHKGLLQKSSFLWDCLRPSTEELILDGRLKPYAVDTIIQFLYTHEIDFSHKFGTIEDLEGDFEKITTIEWTCCYLGVPTCREKAFKKIETAYRAFEFGYNGVAAQMRIKMTTWIYGLDEEYVEAGGWVHRMRRRVLAGWCRDISSIENDKKLLENFENILSEYPTFAFDLEEFLTERAREAPKMKSRLQIFKRAEQAGTERFEKQRAFMFPGALSHPSKLQLPVLRPKKATTQLPTVPSGRPPTTHTASAFAFSADAPTFVPGSRKGLDGNASGDKTPTNKQQVDSVTPSKSDLEPKPDGPPLRKRASRIGNLEQISKFLGSKSIRT